VDVTLWLKVTGTILLVLFHHAMAFHDLHYAMALGATEHALVRALETGSAESQADLDLTLELARVRALTTAFLSDVDAFAAGHGKEFSPATDTTAALWREVVSPVSRILATTFSSVDKQESVLASVASLISPATIRASLYRSGGSDAQKDAFVYAYTRCLQSTSRHEEALSLMRPRIESLERGRVPWFLRSAARSAEQSTTLAPLAAEWHAAADYWGSVYTAAA
jgi:hypothetical protein